MVQYINGTKWANFGLLIDRTPSIYMSVRLNDLSSVLFLSLIRDRPFNLKGGGYGFLFQSKKIFRTTQQLEYLFIFVAQSAKFFFPEFNIRLGTDHLTWSGGGGGGLWFFVSFRIFFSDNTSVRIFIFLSRKARNFSPEFNIRLYDKNSDSYYFFFPPPKSEYFFQQHWESEYFFRKKP